MLLVVDGGGCGRWVWKRGLVTWEVTFNPALPPLAPLNWQHKPFVFSTLNTLQPPAASMLGSAKATQQMFCPNTCCWWLMAVEKGQLKPTLTSFQPTALHTTHTSTQRTQSNIQPIKHPSTTKQDDCWAVQVRHGRAHPNKSCWRLMVDCVCVKRSGCWRQAILFPQVTCSRLRLLQPPLKPACVCVCAPSSDMCCGALAMSFPPFVRPSTTSRLNARQCKSYNSFEALSLTHAAAGGCC